METVNYWQDEYLRRATEAAQEKRRAGKLCGPPPLGYYFAGQKGARYIAIDERIAPLIRRAFELVALKRMSLRKALAEVTALGLKSRKGKPLTYSSFQEMMTNQFYAGYSCDGGGLKQEAHDAIVSADLFGKTQIALAGRTKKSEVIHSYGRKPRAVLNL